MSTRLASGGRLIDRAKPMNFRFNGKNFKGYQGDTLASALLANGQTLVGRSFKYHRPRGIVASGAEEPNALITLGENGRMEPNQRATTTQLFDGLTAKSQNHWPSLEFDVGAVNSLIPQFLPAGFYYKTFMYPRAFWKHVFEPIIRKSAGLGPAPQDRDPDTYEHLHVFVDVLVVGGGIAGLTAARTAALSGAKVLLLEQTPPWGGRGPIDAGEIDGIPAQDWVSEQVEALEKMDNVTMRSRCMGAGVYDHGYALALESVADEAPGSAAPRHRLWRIRAKHIVTATGAIERPIAFAGNDIPGVMLASAARDYVSNWGVSLGDRTVVVANNDDAYRTAIALHEAGLSVAAVVDVRYGANGELPNIVRSLGIKVEVGKGIAKVLGRKHVTGVALCLQAGEGKQIEEIACDSVAMSSGWSPVVHLWSHCGGKLNWNDDLAHFAPDPDRPPLGANGQGFVTVAGVASGKLLSGEALADAHAAGKAAAKSAGCTGKLGSAPKANDIAEAPLAPVWSMPQGAPDKLKAKSWLDFQNDVKVSDVELAAREGYESVEHTKRYTTLGMATDQGKLSNVNGLAVLSGALDAPIPSVGTTTFRPPYTPISMGAIAGEAKGDIFQPLRRTPIHDWSDANGADWEPVGHWRRPYCYLRAGENRENAVAREVTNTRNNLGFLDASTLGKLVVTGPDSGKFLDMLYTNMMSSLKPGKCRYGLMCSENGFLSDDGVVARIDDETYLCHTTSGGADRIHGWMEEWLQTEWWDWKVYVANVTEQYAQIGVVGPNARKIMDKIGSMDLTAETLPFMGFADGTLGNISVRVYRISFSGELSYEIAVPAGQGRALWDLLVAAGEEFGAMPYGTEALHVMRAEKGFIMIGDETDGTIIPQDLGLGWAISKRKEDYLGKRAQARSFMVNPDRWKLVGLDTVGGGVLPDGAYAVADGTNENGQRNVQGRVTSTYHSPTLGKGIAMALVKGGMDREGDVLEFPVPGGAPMQARIVNQVFFDPEGEKQNV